MPNFCIENDDSDPSDLTISFQARLTGADSNQKFFWNVALWSHFGRLDREQKLHWLVRIISGYANFKKVYAGAKQITLGVISRLSSGRVGSRFLTR